MSPDAYVILSALLFTIGAVGFMIRRNAIVAFMCVELMLNAANLLLVSFSRLHGALDGQVAAFFVMVVAAAEVVEQARRQALDLVLGQAHDPVGDLAGPRPGAVQLLTWQEEPGDDAGRVGVQPGRQAVRDQSSSLTQRACCAVASMARVDSAPWLRLRPCRSRPS